MQFELSSSWAFVCNRSSWGGWLPPLPLNWNRPAQSLVIWYHGMKISYRMTSQWRNKTWRIWKCRYSEKKYRTKWKIYLKRVLNVGISLSFWLTRDVNNNSNTNSSLRFKAIQSILLSKWRLLIILGGNHHPRTPSLTDNHTWRGYPIFFHQNNHTHTHTHTHTHP